MPASSLPEGAAAQITLVQQLFVQNLGALRGVLHSLVRDTHRVDDLVQETFLSVTAKPGAFREGTSFRPWAFTIARYKMLESLRRRPDSEALSEEVLDVL